MKNSNITILFSLLILSACSSGNDPQTVEPPPPPPPAVKQEMPIVDISSNIERLVTFARVATSIKFYYPGDGAYSTKWDEFIAYGMYRIAITESEEDFAETMRELFSDVAPGVSFNDDNFQAPTYNDSDQVITWLQDGYFDRVDGEYTGYEQQRIVLTYAKVMADDIAAVVPEFSYAPQLDFLTNNTSYQVQYSNLKMDLPLILATDETGTSIPAGSAFVDSENWFLVDNISNQYGCLSSFATNWALIQNYWPYHTTIDVDWDAELPKLLLSCGDTSRVESIKQFHLSFTLLQDNHVSASSLYSPIPNWFTVPVGFDFVEGSVVATFVPEEVSSEVLVGDQLIAIDGVATEEVIAQINPLTLKSESKQTLWSTILHLMRYPEGQSVNLSMQRQSGESYEISLTANSSVYEKFRNVYYVYNIQIPETYKFLENGIYYINLSDVTADDVEPILTQLNQATAVVFDMRYYPEDYYAIVDILSHFVDNDLSAAPMYNYYAHTPDRALYERAFIPQTMPPSLPKFDIPSVAISARTSQSFNEHMLAYIQNANIPILGEATSGINGNIIITKTFGGYENDGMNFIFTGLEVTQNDGTAHIGVGIIPDIPVARTIDSIVENRDNQLQSAVDYLMQQLGE